MILADSNVWIRHLREGDERLRRFLLEQRVRTSDVVIGELLLGAGLPKRFAADLSVLPRLPTPLAGESRGLVERHPRDEGGRTTAHIRSWRPEGMPCAGLRSCHVNAFQRSPTAFAHWAGFAPSP